MSEKKKKAEKEEIEKIELTEAMLAEAFRFIGDEELECLDPKCDVYILEKCYLPQEDVKLRERGVEFCARTEVDKRIGPPAVKNLLMIRRGEKEAGIQCIHTKVMEAIPCEMLEREGVIEREISVEHRPELRAELTPEQHYVSLRSFVDGLLEEGIQKIVIESFKHEIETGEPSPLVDVQLRSQLASALAELVPEESAELVLTTLEYTVGDDPQRLEAFTSEFKKVICEQFGKDDLSRLNKINGGVSALEIDLKRCILQGSTIDDIPKEVLREFLMDVTVEDLAVELLQKPLATESDWRTRFLLARQTELPYSLVEKLARDEDVVVQNEIASRQYLRTPELYALADSEDMRVLRTLASRVGLPDELLKKLAQKDDVTVRRFIAAQQVLPVAVIEELILEEDEEVRKFMVSQKYLSEEFQELIFQTSGVRVRREQVTHGVLSEKMQKMIATEGDKTERQFLTAREKLGDEVKRVLAKDTLTVVREDLAIRDDLPVDVVKELMRDKNLTVREMLVGSQPTFPEEVWNIVADDYDTLEVLLERAELPETVIKRIAENPDDRFPIKLAGKRDLPDKVVDMLLAHENAEVRASVVENIEWLHPNDMWKLSEDEAVEVRVALALRSDLNAEIGYEMWKRGGAKVEKALEEMGWQFEEQWIEESALEEEEEK